tara:strand:+ start:1230 stop:1844 length:615 start_codon:yes stop_codon:yes gene_type:complete
MLVMYNGDRVKLAGELFGYEDPNNTQNNIQPLNQQSTKQPIQAKGVNPAAGAPPSDPTTPTIYNPTLQRMGIQMPPPKNPTSVTTKLSEAIQRRGPAMDNITVRQAIAGRKYYDSPYLSDLQHARLKLRAPVMGAHDRFKGNILAGGLATGGVLAGALLGRGVGGKALGTVLGGGLGFLGGKMYNTHRVNRVLAEHEPQFYSNT